MKTTYQVPISMSWIPVDPNLDFQVARAYKTVKTADIASVPKYLSKLIDQGYEVANQSFDPLQLTSLSSIVCDPTQIYACRSTTWKVDMRFGHFQLKPVVRTISSELWFYKDVVFFSIPTDYRSYYDSWIMTQKPGDTFLKGWPNIPRLKQKHTSMLLQHFFNHDEFWRITGPKTKTIEQAKLQNRRIELQL